MKKLILALLILTTIICIASCGKTTPPSTDPVVEEVYKVEKLTIGGVDISEFVIVLGPDMSENEQHIATLLQKKIADVCGEEIAIVDYTTPEQKYEILFGNTGRAESSALTPASNTASGAQSGTKLAFVGNGTDANGAMMKTLYFIVDGIPACESYDIIVESFDSQPYKAPHLTETNMPMLEDATDKFDPDFYADTENVLKRFYYSVDRMPDEITVLQPFETEDFPLSEQNIIFVAPNGSDENEGTIESPLATLPKALKKLDNGGGIIYFREGVYDTTDWGSITANGKSYSPIFIKPYEDEKVLFNSGKNIPASALKPLDTQNDALAERIPVSSWDSVVYVNLFELGWTEKDFGSISESFIPSLYLGNVTGEISRYPNSDEPLLYFKKAYDTGSVTSRDASHLYEDWIKRVKNWDTWKKAGGTESTSYTFDKSVYKNLKEAVADAQALDTVAHTKYTDSFGNLNLDYGWSIKLEDLTPIKEKWVNTGDIWFYGNTYSGYRFYNCQIAEIDRTKLALVSVHGTILGATSSGNSPTGYNNYYLYNVLEALDHPGEWYLDKASGNLYIYKTEGLENASITYSNQTKNILSFSGSSNVIIDGIRIAQGGSTGVYMTRCNNMVIQRCEISQTESCSIYATISQECAFIYNDISDAGATQIYTTTDSSELRSATPTRHVIQNNYCHSPRYSQKIGISASGINTVVSHNHLVGSCLYFENTYECVYEYNRVQGGSPDVSDGGLAYLGGYNDMLNHIRYNYLYDWNTSNTGIYFDTLSSFNYAYYNIVDSSTATTKSTRFLYSSTGHYNVFYGNLLVGRSTDYIAESTLFFDETASNYFTFMGYSEDFVESLDKYKSNFFTCFPEIKNFYTIMKQHVNERTKDGYVRNELEIYLCSPNSNVIVNNLLLGAERIVDQMLLTKTNSVTGEKMTSLDIIRNNHLITDYAGVLADHANGDYTIVDEALSAVKSVIRDYRQLSIENVGLTYTK